MNTIIHNPDDFRNKIRDKICLICPITKQSARHIEQSIYNNSIKTSDNRDIVKKWNNPTFVEIYINILRSIFINLQTSPEFNARIASGEIPPCSVGALTHQEMAPTKWKTLIQDKAFRDENKYTYTIESSTDNFTCRKCKSKKCSYYQLQTRSSDEPMTTFVTCLNCGNRWKC